MSSLLKIFQILGFEHVNIVDFSCRYIENDNELEFMKEPSEYQKQIMIRPSLARQISNKEIKDAIKFFKENTEKYIKQNICATYDPKMATTPLIFKKINMI